jgi:hypothetical protein
MYADNLQIFASLQNYRGDYLPEDDVSFVRESLNADPRGRMYLGPVSGWRDILAVSSIPRSQGLLICHKSAGTADIGDGADVDHEAGNVCYTVDDPIDFYATLSPTQNWTQVFRSCTDCVPRPGASGGPWYHGNTAYGIYTGVLDNDIRYMYYERINVALTALEGAYDGDVRLYCNGVGGNPCGP